ncbi:MAG: helix-hairpin-helix domain-containing protein [Dysgonamonadaceae bacterium]|jgi:DNA uptake protein ComE-like DNA-binding protein|nr:helix-hairpin-helix domain-containing protein [Dysgonamonadaceae bacterium]
MKWKDFLYFQSGEKVAVILLIIVIVLLFILNIVLSNRDQFVFDASRNDSLNAELARFHAELEKQENDTNSVTYYGYEPRRNTTNRYERKSFERSGERRPDNSYLSYPKTEKLSAGETLSLNETDTAQWKKIPGIGSAFAGRIVKYRNLLGGFASVNQLREVYGFDDELFAKVSPFVQADGIYQKIAVNKLEFSALLKHPYLNYKQVKAITDLRKRKGNITSIDELAMLDEFAENDLERLKPYLSFE